MTLCLVGATALAGCARDAAPPADTAATPEGTPAATAPVAHFDQHSYAEPGKVRIEDLALALAVDFEQKQLSGSATYTLDWVDPEATQLVLDTWDHMTRATERAAARKIAQSVAPTSIFDCFWRMRIKSNYGTIDPYLVDHISESDHEIKPDIVEQGMAGLGQAEAKPLSTAGAPQARTAAT